MGEIIKKEMNQEVENPKSLITQEVVVQYLQNFGFLKTLTKEEAKQFIMICVNQNLNPVKREAYAVKYYDRTSQKYNFSIITGYEVYLKRAEATNLLDGWKAEVIRNKDGDIIGAKTTIHRKDWQEPFIWEVDMAEYNRNIALWKDKPSTMIKKVCIAQAFRLAFPEALGGLPYTREEQVSSGMINEEFLPTVEISKRNEDTKEDTQKTQEEQEEQVIQEVDNEQIQQNQKNPNNELFEKEQTPVRQPTKKQLDTLFNLLENLKDYQDVVKEGARLAKVHIKDGVVNVNGSFEDVSDALSYLFSEKRKINN